MKTSKRRIVTAVVGAVAVVSVLASAVTALNVNAAEQPKEKVELRPVDIAFINKIESKAQAGDVTAQLKLGFFYYNGMHVVKDLEKAAYWLEKAHRQGDLSASNLLGELYLFNADGDDIKLAMSYVYFHSAADGGLALGQFNLGVSYYVGQGVEKDHDKAFKLFLASAKQDLTVSKFYLALMYERGHGTSKNLAKAFSWYKSGSDNGDAYSASRLGYFYGTGRGVKVSATKAFSYYKIAAVRGLGSAQLTISKLYYSGIGVHKNVVKAYVWAVFAEARGVKNAKAFVAKVSADLTYNEIKMARKWVLKLVNDGLDSEVI